MSVSGPFKYRLTTAFERTCGGDAHPSTCAATITAPSSVANRNVFRRVVFGRPAAHVDGPCGSVSGVPVERRSEPACDILVSPRSHPPVHRRADQAWQHEPLRPRRTTF